MLAGLFSGASADELLVYLDLDASPATGCLVITVEGPFHRVEQALITRHQNGQVTDVVRRVCTDINRRALRRWIVRHK